MGKKRKELTHEEIWDDTGLIESWNASYEEYKLYHSIHARGENVEEALAALKRDKETEDQENEDKTHNSGTNNGSTAHLQLANNSDGPPEGHDNVAATPSAEKTAPGSLPGPGSGMGELLAAPSSQDSALKNLMMSWYWAGYYTGLHEGQAAGTSLQGSSQL